MAEISAFVYGWIAGIAAVIIWILYGIDTLLKLMRFLNDVLAHIPGLSHLANEAKNRHGHSNRGARTGESNRGGLSKFNVLAAEEGLEGLTGSTKKVTPITAGGLCMMSWYGPDGTTGAPIECRLALENSEVTIYQLLRLGDNVGVSGSAGGKPPGGERGTAAQASLVGQGGKRSNSKDCDTNAFRSAAGVTVAEHRKGKVSVLHTTVMELKHFNKPNKGTGEPGSGGNNNSTSNSNNNNSKEKGNSSNNNRNTSNGKGSEAGSAGNVTPNGSKTKRKDSSDGGSGRDSVNNNNNKNKNNNNNANDSSSNILNNSSTAAVPEGVCRPGVDPIFTGRVLIWRTMDGRPLFDSIRRSRPATGSSFAANVRRGGSIGSMSNTGSGSGSASRSFAHSPSGDSLSDDASFNTSMESDGNSENDDTDDCPSDGDGYGSDGSIDGRLSNTSVNHNNSSINNNSSSGSMQGSRHKKNSGHSGHHHHHNGSRHGGHHHKNNAEMGDMANWSCVIIRFERARESERWYTLLSGLREARAWHDFAKTLPNPDTINTFLSRFFFQNMRLHGLSDAIIKQIRKKLRELPAKKFPRDLGGQLILDEFLVGTQIPWITDVSEPTASANGEIGFDFNLMYKGGEGGFTLFFRLALEFLGIRVPHVVFSVKLIELEATVHISIGPPPSKKFWIGGHKPPILKLEVHQGCASGKGILHRVLTSLPDLSGIMTNLIKLYLFSDMVLPYMDDFPLPSVVKSPKASLRDMRVRTFDRQRAAKISSAPARATSAPVVAPASPLLEQFNKEAEELKKKREEEEKEKEEKEASNTKASSSADASRKQSSASSTHQTADRSANAGHAAGASPAPSEQRLSALTTPRERGTSDGRRAQNSMASTTRSAHPNPTSGNSGHSFAHQASGAANNSTIMSPIVLSSPNGPSSGSFNNTQRSLNATTTSMNANAPRNNDNASVSSVPHSTAGSMTNRNLLREGDVSGSEDVLSSTTKKRSGSSGAMRNLKDLLKIKGKDMTRESVSRSKNHKQP